jgi:hypothetical protein
MLATSPWLFFVDPAEIPHIHPTKKKARGMCRLRTEIASPAASEEDIFVASIGAGAVLLINVTLTIWAAVTSKSGTQIGTIY